MTRCTVTGVTKPECGCRACNREQIERWAPHLITHGEDGHPLPDTSGLVLEHIPVEELDEELAA